MSNPAPWTWAALAQQRGSGRERRPGPRQRAGAGPQVFPASFFANLRKSLVFNDLNMQILVDKPNR